MIPLFVLCSNCMYSYICFLCTLKYRINGGGGNNRGGGGGWKWFEITIIGGGWNNRGGGLLGEIENSPFLR